MAPKPIVLVAGLVLSLAIVGSYAAPAAAGTKAPGAKAAAGSKAEAKKAYKKAVQLMKQEKWAEALDHLEASHEAKTDPSIRYDKGTCLFHLGRWIEASVELTAYLDEAGDDVGEDRRAEVEATLEEIEGHIGDVNIVCDVDGASLTVDGVPSDDWKLRLDEGAHEILVEAEGHNAVTASLDVKGGKAVRLEVDMITPDDDDVKAKKGKKAGKKGGVGKAGHEERARLPVCWFAGTAALAGALALTAVITGSVALARQDHYSGMDAADDWKPYRDATLNLGIATDVLWGVAAGAAAAAVVLAVFTDFGRPAEKKTTLSVSPTLGTYGLVLEVGF